MQPGQRNWKLSAEIHRLEHCSILYEALSRIVAREVIKVIEEGFGGVGIDQVVIKARILGVTIVLGDFNGSNNDDNDYNDGDSYQGDPTAAGPCFWPFP